ncbi:MAG: glycosyltransferase family 2 protein [Nitrososphaerota archaeon]|nr:glycosyltransferase family 2 protein [Nitrososphaerota archaeon]
MSRTTLLQSLLVEQPKISLIMPAYQLADKIEASIFHAKQMLEQLMQNYEVIVVDDGSVDATYENASRLSDDRVKVIRNSKNQGKGYSFKRGIEESTGAYVILSDADMDVNPSKIALYLEALKKHDIVVASKRLPSSSYSAPLVRKFLSASFNALVDVMMGLRISDTQTGLKAFRSDAIKRIMQFVSVKRYAFDVEVLVVGKLLGYGTIELPVSVSLSKRFSLRNVMYMLIDLLGIFYRYRIIRWYQKNLSTATPTYKPIVRI